MKRKIIIKKSFSQVDKGFIKLFKHRRKLPPISGEYKINDLIAIKGKQSFEAEKNLDNTGAKLDLIISDMKNSNSYITKQFLEDTSLQIENNDLRQRMQVLYNRRKTKEKKENLEKKIKKRENIDSTQEAIQHMLYFAKKYAVDKETVRIKTEQNNKKPPICRYTPSLSYISKHIPSVYFGFHKTVKNEINDEMKENNRNKSNRKNEEGKNSGNDSSNKIKEDIEDNLMITENKNIKSINNNIYKNIFSSNKKHKIKIYKNILRKHADLNKEIKKPSLLEKIITKTEKEPNNNINNNLTAGKYSLNIQREKIMRKKIPNVKLNQIKMKYNISVPVFNKMTSREKNYPLIDKNKNMADYDPNYDAIYPTNYKYNIIDEKMKKKRYKLRKILGSYNTAGEYLLLPILNK